MQTNVIELKRQALADIVTQAAGNLQDKAVLAASQELDLLILTLYRPGSVRANGPQAHRRPGDVG